jgi:hypothetical protein
MVFGVEYLLASMGGANKKQKLIYIASILWSVVNGWFDSRRIKRGKKINHEKNAGLYCGFVFVACAFTDFWYAIPLLCLRALVFDHALNLFRGLRINYQPFNPESVVDKFENAVFGKYAWYVSNGIYLAIFIISVCLIENII